MGRSAAHEATWKQCVCIRYQAPLFAGSGAYSKIFKSFITVCGWLQVIKHSLRFTWVLKIIIYIRYKPLIFVKHRLNVLHGKCQKEVYQMACYSVSVILICFSNYWQYALVLAWFWLQYMSNIFSSFSYIADLFHEPLDESNNSIIWKMRKIFAILYEVIVR